MVKSLWLATAGKESAFSRSARASMILRATSRAISRVSATVRP